MVLARCRPLPSPCLSTAYELCLCIYTEDPVLRERRLARAECWDMENNRSLQWTQALQPEKIDKISAPRSRGGDGEIREELREYIGT